MIFGILEDNTSLLTWSFNLISFKFYNEIFLYYFLYSLSKIINSVYLLSYFTLIILIINFFFFFYLYLKFFSNKFISVLISLITVFSPYMYYKSQNHIALVNIWIYALFVYFIIFKLNKDQSASKFGIYGLILGLTGLVSNYIFFFSLIFSFFYFIIEIIFQIYDNKRFLKTMKHRFQKIISFYILLLLPFSILNLNIIKYNFFSENISADTSYKISRPLDDFFIFSSRPWYYFLPSVDNPFYGDYSKNIFNYLEYDWGSFLAKNYFKSEHSSSYLGITNFILALIGFFYLRRNKEKIENYTQLIFLGITGIVLVFFTMPPFLEFGSFKLYFPSYLIAEFFPMFRVTARLGILILIIQLVFTGFGFKYILDRFNELNIKKAYTYLIIIVLTFVSLSEFFIPFKFTNISQIPDVFSYIKENTAQGSKILIMPGNKYNLALFWSKDHNREIIVLNNIMLDSKNISYDDFVNKYLYTCQGLKVLENKEIDYFVYFYNSDINSDFKKEFLNINLIKIAEFRRIDQEEEIQTLFFRIIFTGNNYSNQSVIYKIPDIINCK